MDKPMHINNKQLIVVGNRVLIRHEKPEDRTAVGLYLPQSVVEKESVQSGRVVATGPGIPIPSSSEIDDEPWKEAASVGPKYIPMQAQPGDYALYLRKEAVEVKFEGEKYVIVPAHALLALVREDEPM